MAIPFVLLFLAAALASYLATAGVRRLAQRLGAVDLPDDRKLHAVATPRLGGLGIIFGFGFPLSLMATNAHAAELVSKNINYLLAVVFSGILIIALGLYDDLNGSDATKKFTVQTLAALILVRFGFHFDTIFIPWVGDVDLGWFGIVVTVLWVVGVINAINLIDGMDSLAAVVVMTIAVAFGAIAVLRGDVFSLVIMTALAGSLLGFLPWNRFPAKIFMGDSGSLFIGLLLAACSVARNSKAPTAVIIGGPTLALALPVLDTLFVMHRRFTRESTSFGKRISRMFNADRNHIHHILVERYGSQRRVVLSIWLMTLLFSVAGFVTIVPGYKGFGYALGLLTFLVLLFFRFHRGGRGAEAQGETGEDPVARRAAS